MQRQAAQQSTVCRKMFSTRLRTACRSLSGPDCLWNRGRWGARFIDVLQEVVQRSCATKLCNEVVQRSCATSCFWFGGMVCTWFALTLCEARDSCCCPRKSIACDREIITCVVGQFCYSRLQEKKSGGRMTINHNVLRKPRKLLVCTGRTAVVTTRDMQGCSVPVVSMMMK